MGKRRVLKSRRLCSRAHSISLGGRHLTGHRFAHVALCTNKMRQVLAQKNNMLRILSLHTGHSVSKLDKVGVSRV